MLDIEKNFHKETIETNPDIKGDKHEEELMKKFILLKPNFKLDNELTQNILRSQIVLLTSSVDFYIHELLKIEIMSIIRKERKVSNKLKDCLISLETFIKYRESEYLEEQILEEEIIRRNSYDTFLSSNNIKRGLLIITSKNIYKELYSKLGFKSEKLLEKRINEIYQRRNKIVHQLDYNYCSNERGKLSKELVEEYIEFYEQFIKELHRLIINENI